MDFLVPALLPSRHRQSPTVPVLAVSLFLNLDCGCGRSLGNISFSAPMLAWCTFAASTDADDIDAVLGPILLLGLLLTGVWFLYRHVRRRKAAFRWPLIEATIQSEFASETANAAAAMGVAGAVASRMLCNAVLQYSYNVAGEFYSGYIIFGGPYTSREDAAAAARPWVGKKISVRYNPAQPHQSALLNEDGAPPGMRGLGENPPASSGVITLSLK